MPHPTSLGPGLSNSVAALQNKTCDGRDILPCSTQTHPFITPKGLPGPNPSNTLKLAPGTGPPSQRNIPALPDIAAPLHEEGIEEDGLYEASFAPFRALRTFILQMPAPRGWLMVLFDCRDTSAEPVSPINDSMSAIPASIRSTIKRQL
jgi:hypothetical protein